MIMMIFVRRNIHKYGVFLVGKRKSRNVNITLIKIINRCINKKGAGKESTASLITGTQHRLL